MANHVIYLLERTQPLTQVVSTYANGYVPRSSSRPMSTREAVAALRQARTTAQEKRDFTLAAQISSALAGVHLDQFNLEEAHTDLMQAAATLRNPDDLKTAPDGKDANVQLAKILGSLAALEYRLGIASAQQNCQDAIEIARQTDQGLLRGGLLCTLGAILCFQGHYQEANQLFGEAQRLVADDPLGQAWYQHSFAHEYSYDLGQYAQAITCLEAAQPIFAAQSSLHMQIENFLILADCYTRQGNLPRANEIVQAVEGLVATHKQPWYRSELYLVKARLMIAENNMKLAAQCLYVALGEIGAQQDIRSLTAIYRLLGLVLERDRRRLEDARDALERAIITGRARSRRLHLAMALRSMGQHLKRFTNRPTARARGNGYQYEAERMVADMGLTLPEG